MPSDCRIINAMAGLRPKLTRRLNMLANTPIRQLPIGRRIMSASFTLYACRAPPTRPPTGGHGRQAGVVLPSRRHRRRRTDVPCGRRVRADLQPRLRRRRQRFRPIGRGRSAPGLDDGRRQGQLDRVAVLAAPVRGAQRADRQHHEAGDRLHRGQAVRRAQRRRLAGHADRVCPATRRATWTPAAARPSSSSTSRTISCW